MKIWRDIFWTLLRKGIFAGLYFALGKYNIIASTQLELAATVAATFLADWAIAQALRFLARWKWITTLKLPDDTTLEEAHEISKEKSPLVKIKEVLTKTVAREQEEALIQLPGKTPPPEPITGIIGESHIRPPFTIEDEDAEEDSAVLAEDERATGPLEK